MTKVISQAGFFFFFFFLWGGGVLAGESIVYCVSNHNKHFLQVCIADFNAQVGDETAKELSNKYGEGKVLFTKCDVTSQTDMEGKQAQTHTCTHAFTHTRTHRERQTDRQTEVESCFYHWRNDGSKVFKSESTSKFTTKRGGSLAATTFGVNLHIVNNVLAQLM